MERIVLPLLMYKETGSVKKGTKKRSHVVPSWNHLYIIVKRPSKELDGRGKRKYQLQPILDKWAILHKEKMIDILLKWKEKHNWETTENKMVAVKVWVFWNNAGKKDCHNLDKLFMDAMNEIVYDDDSNALLQYQYFYIDRENPRIEIEVEVVGEVDRKPKSKTPRKKKEECHA